jgi:nucleoside-diphosphate-sugar epimerase
MRRALIVGCGDLGTRVALGLIERGWWVVGGRRRPEQIPAPIEAIALDLNAIDRAALPASLDAVVVVLTPDARNEAAYRRTYLDGPIALRAALPEVAQWLFVSSTAGYGDHAGAWVDETSAPRNPAWNGRVLLEAEAHFVDALIVRLAGIYGPGRNMLIERVKRGASASATRWTNRIHVDDAAGLISEAIDQRWSPAIINGVDRTPALEIEVLLDLAERLGLPPPPIDERAPGEHKRIRTIHPRAANRTLRYPSWREGYAALLEEAR